MSFVFSVFCLHNKEQVSWALCLIAMLCLLKSFPCLQFRYLSILWIRKRGDLDIMVIHEWIVCSHHSDQVQLVQCLSSVIHSTSRHFFLRCRLLLNGEGMKSLIIKKLDYLFECLPLRLSFVSAVFVFNSLFMNCIPVSSIKLSVDFVNEAVHALFTLARTSICETPVFTFQIKWTNCCVILEWFT